ncbi:MAG TPA: HEAT repeat domain-containing protein [Isosphaeraceae bacterium]|jgi:HEAT repeat protein
MADHLTVAELIEGLKCGQPGVRAKCALDLGGRHITEEESRKALPALLVASKDKDLQVRMKAVWAMGQIGPTAVPALIEALKDDFWIVRNDAARTLGEMGPAAKDAIPALLEALNDPDYSVRESSASALDRIDPAAKDDRRR